MNLKKVSAKILSVVMALAMMLAVCAPAILAATEETEGKKELNYVSLGDSMTNGLGHDGYWNNGYLEEAPATYAAKLAAWLAGVADSSEFTENADGTVTFNGDKAIVNWAQLATSAARVEDLRYILELGKTNAYPGDMWTYTELLGGHSIGADGSDHVGQNRWGKDGVLFEGYAEMYQESVMNADVITYAVGNANFGVYLSDMVFQVLGLPNYGIDYSYATIDHALELASVDAEIKATVLEAYEKAMTALEEKIPSEMVKKIAERLAYVVASYLINTAGALDRIVELNPDAEIILVGLVNNMSGFEFDVVVNGETVKVDVAAMMAETLEPLNAYLAGYATANKLEGKYENAKFYYAEAEHVETWADDFGNAYGEFVYDEEADDFGYPESRYWCHTRFVDNITGFVLSMAFGQELAGVINADDVKAYEIAAAKGSEALLAYAQANPQKVAYIAAYLGIVDAILNAFEADNVVDLDGMVMPTEFDFNAIVTPLLGGVMEAYGKNAVTEAEACFEAVLINLARTQFGLDEDTFSDEYVMATVEALAEPIKAPLYEAAATAAQLYATPKALSDAFATNGTVCALLVLYGRMSLANGLASHPSANGHQQLADAVIDAYSKGYTAELETIKNMIAAMQILGKFVYDNHEQIYADAYQYAEENGIIDQINVYIDEAEYYVGQAYAWYLEHEDEIEAEAKKYVTIAIDEANKYLEELRTIVNEELDRFDAQVQKQIDTLLGQINKQIETLNKLIVDTANAINDYVYAQALALQAQIKYQIEVFEAQVRRQLNTLRAYIDAKIAALKAEINAKIAALKAYAEEQLAKIEAVADRDLTKLIETIKYIDSVKGEYFDAILGNVNALVEAATNYYYVRTSDSFYAAIGGEGYAELVANGLGVSFEALAGLRASDLIAILDKTYENDAYGDALLANNADLVAKYLETIKKADLITLDLGEADLFGFVANQVTGMLLDTYASVVEFFVINGILEAAPTVEAYEMDWTRFADFISAEDVAEIKAAIDKAITDAGIPETYKYTIEHTQNIGGKDLVISYPVDLYPAQFVAYAIECYLYAAANYTCNFTAAVEAIHAVNPNAQIVIVGSTNPLAELELTVEGVDIGKAIALFVEAIDAQAFSCALTLPGTTFVSVKGAETGIDAENIIDFEKLCINTGAFGTTEAGNAFIADKILSAITVSDCEHKYDNDCDAICNVCNAERVVEGHKYNNKCDADCNVCGESREVGAHTFGEWVTVTEPTTEAEGLKERSCTECGFKESEAIAKLEKPVDPEGPQAPLDPGNGNKPAAPDNTPDSDVTDTGEISAAETVAIVASSTVVAAVGGLAIFWFAVKKKSFIDLVAIFRK